MSRPVFASLPPGSWTSGRPGCEWAVASVPMNITENQLDEWVRGHAIDAQGLVVELLWRLVAASCPSPTERRFPLGDSTGQHGPDGVLTTASAFEPFIPEGRSLWEVGTGLNAAAKATKDYANLVRLVPADERASCTFMFVTPLSGRRDWESNWSAEGKATWLAKRRGTNEWKDVRIVDGTNLVDWLHQFPSVQVWLAERMGLPRVDEFSTPEQHWHVVRAIGEPPPLASAVFTTAREDARRAFEEVLGDTRTKLRLDTHYPDQCIDFLCACIESLEPERRADAVGRCLIVSTQAAWHTYSRIRTRHILIADPTLDLSGTSGTKLIQSARNGGHSVIYSGPPGGIPDPARVQLGSPKEHQLQEALVTSGYPAERARTIAHKSGGNLGSLLRCLQNLSSLPDWATHSSASDLAIAQFLGGWVDSSESDRSIAEHLSGKAYGEWIAVIRALARRAGTPLTHKEGTWSFGSRYEAWYALGPHIFDEHLERFRTAAQAVFKEDDPQFELPPEQRFAASLFGKSLRHSRILRAGFADTLALLGSHSTALTSCSSGRGERVAREVVRDILHTEDWRRWASLDDVLPLLAEAAPQALLDAVDEALASAAKPLMGVFKQESAGLAGRSYITGLLWSLETLAWDPQYLGRSALCLGELAACDPGGNWGNRPSASLSMIFLPWYPQTCAAVQQRLSAVSRLLRETPAAGWPLLIGMLPGEHTTSHGTRKPAWRSTIPDDWTAGVTNADYHAQIDAYAELLVNEVEREPIAALRLVNHMAALPRPSFERALQLLSSSRTLDLPPEARASIWTALSGLVTKHRKYATSDWALPTEAIELAAKTANALVPISPDLRHAYLFTERELDLYEEKGSYESQQRDLVRRRLAAAEEIASGRSLPELLDFATTIQSPWQFGYALGSSEALSLDEAVLPTIGSKGRTSDQAFDRGYVWGRFNKLGWDWVDALLSVHVSDTLVATLFTYLPFEPSSWTRVAKLEKSAQRLYWTTVGARPFGSSGDLVYAARQFMEHGRPHSALSCLYGVARTGSTPDLALVAEALTAAAAVESEHPEVSPYEIGKLITLLQTEAGVPLERMIQIEWAYLPLLDRHSNASPIHLGAHLSDNPSFFCEVLRLAFRSTKDPEVALRRRVDENVARNAYRLLTEWKVPPGQAPDGGFEPSRLLSWWAAVRKESESTGHLEIAMTIVGHVLTYGPSDPKGLWLHKAAAQLLDEKGADDLRSGYISQLYNSRGAHSVNPSGNAETALAEQFRGKATSVDAAGFPRLAGALRDLASSYDLEAIRVRDLFDDRT